jgi:hypothetical protein
MLDRHVSAVYSTQLSGPMPPCCGFAFPFDDRRLMTSTRFVLGTASRGCQLGDGPVVSQIEAGGLLPKFQMADADYLRDEAQRQAREAKNSKSTANHMQSFVFSTLSN